MLDKYYNYLGNADRENVRQKQLNEGPKAGRNVKNCYIWTQEYEGEGGKRNWRDKQRPDYAGF